MRYSKKLFYLPNLRNIAAGLAILSSVTLIPIMFSSDPSLYPFPFFTILSVLAALSSLVGVGVSMATWRIALQRFRDEEFQASLGPLVSWKHVLSIPSLLPSRAHFLRAYVGLDGARGGNRTSVCRPECYLPDMQEGTSSFFQIYVLMIREHIV